jgi:hypothetical protein
VWSSSSGSSGKVVQELQVQHRWGASAAAARVRNRRSLFSSNKCSNCCTDDAAAADQALSESGLEQLLQLQLADSNGQLVRPAGNVRWQQREQQLLWSTMEQLYIFGGSSGSSCSPGPVAPNTAAAGQI